VRSPYGTPATDRPWRRDEGSCVHSRQHLRLVRVPNVAAINRLPGNGTGAAPSARLVVDRADASVRAALASILRNPGLREDAQQRRTAAEKREHAMRLRQAAERQTERAELQHSSQWDQAGARLAHEARSLVAAGAELLGLCTNTMHKVANAITDAVDVPPVDIADATAEAVHAQHLHTVGLLATAYTMEQDFYNGRLRDRHGLNVLVPNPEDRRIIYDELCMGIINDSSRDQYRQIMRKLVDH
jgi:aspartate/glutamate racemase